MTGELLCSQPPLGVADTMFPNQSATPRRAGRPGSACVRAGAALGPVTSQAAAAALDSRQWAPLSTPSGAFPAGTCVSPVACQAAAARRRRMARPPGNAADQALRAVA